MNWKQLHETCPLTLLEWVKAQTNSTIITINNIDQNTDPNWLEVTYSDKFYDNNRICLSNYRIWAIPYYFDGLGIHISTPLEDEANGSFRCVLTEKKKEGVFNMSHFLTKNNNWERLCQMGYEMNFPNRLSALEAGIEKAFQIREQLLNSAPKP